MSHHKILSIENLKRVVLKNKAKGSTIVLCHGTFDLLHIGHIKHFKEAKKLGDKLIVTITSDEYVNKGPKRPTFTEKYRLEAVAALDVVDYVALSEYPTAVQAIELLKPHIYCKGPDYKNHKEDISGEITNETRMTKKFGGKIYYTKDISFSSSQLINSFSDTYSLKHKKIINNIKKKYNFLKIRNLIEELKKIKVLVIGEVIIDQYYFCEAMGKSGKEPMLALKNLRNEQYLGGAGAICGHLSQFCNKISLLTMVGEKGEFINYIRRSLTGNINIKYIRKKKSPTIIKKRFLDYVSHNKVLGVYTINDDLLVKKDEKKFIQLLKKEISRHDLIIISDYGHGLISKKSAKLISKSSKYLALNAQINAANIGYHSMRNYKNIDCVVINETELRHEMREKNDKIELLMKKFSRQQIIKNLVVTRGIEGALLYNENKFTICEAFTDTPVDKIGAGDAMLSIIALFFKFGFTKELSLLVGSLAAGQSAKTIGNKETVSKTKILKALDHMLK